MGRLINKLLFTGVLAFMLWYLLRQTTLGAGFTGDLMKMGGYVSTNTSEGLRTAQNVSGRLY
jgi:hypothetical protein